MTHEEKRAWIMLVVTAVTYCTYLAVVVGRAGGGPLSRAAYADALLWTVGGAILTAIVAEIGISVVSPRASRVTDVRDREIGRLGEYTGQAFVVIGAVSAMLMAMAGWDRFWIANVIYLCFALSSVLGSVTKIAAYRWGLPQW
jgi:hypothetical protein